MLAMIAKEAESLGGLDFSSVTDVTMGSAPLTLALFEKVQAMFPTARVSNGYGTTEGGPSPFGPHPDGLPRPPTSVGHPSAGADVELREGPSPDEGVLYMRSPMLMRADDMFVVGGENVWPGEVEKLIERMPGVHQASVVPVPDEIKGMLPFAFVVRRSDADVSETDVKTFAIANGPAFADAGVSEICGQDGFGVKANLACHFRIPRRPSASWHD